MFNRIYSCLEKWGLAAINHYYNKIEVLFYRIPEEKRWEKFLNSKRRFKYERAVMGAIQIIIVSVALTIIFMNLLTLMNTATTSAFTGNISIDFSIKEMFALVFMILFTVVGLSEVYCFTIFSTISSFIFAVMLSDLFLIPYCFFLIGVLDIVYFFMLLRLNALARFSLQYSPIYKENYKSQYRAEIHSYLSGKVYRMVSDYFSVADKSSAVKGNAEENEKADVENSRYISNYEDVCDANGNIIVSEPAIFEAEPDREIIIEEDDEPDFELTFNDEDTESKGFDIPPKTDCVLPDIEVNPDDERDGYAKADDEKKKRLLDERVPLPPVEGKRKRYRQ